MRKSIIGLAIVAGLAGMGQSVRADYVGNPLDALPQADGSPPLVILGEYSHSSSTPSPSSTISFPSNGTVNDVKIYSRASGAPFTVYTIRDAGKDSSANQLFQFINSASFTTTGSGEVETFTVPANFNVQAGDLLAFAGTGPAYDNSSPTSENDATYSNSPGGGFSATPPVAGTTYSFGANGNSGTNYDYIPNFGPARTYSIGADYTPSSPEPGSIGILAAVCVGALARRRRS